MYNRIVQCFQLSNTIVRITTPFVQRAVSESTEIDIRMDRKERNTCEPREFVSHDESFCNGRLDSVVDLSDNLRESIDDAYLRGQTRTEDWGVVCSTYHRLQANDERERMIDRFRRRDASLTPHPQ